MNLRLADWIFLLAAALVATGFTHPAGATIDLLASTLPAKWASGQLPPDGGVAQVTPLSWPKENDFAVFAGVAPYALEDGSTCPAPHLHPMWVDHGTVSGHLPWVALPPGAVFEAEVGFLSGAINSDGVTFQVYESHYDRGSNLVREQLAQVGKRYAGWTAPLRIDLSHLAGKIVSIELRVDAGATSLQDWPSGLPHASADSRPGRSRLPQRGTR